MPEIGPHKSSADIPKFPERPIIGSLDLPVGYVLDASEFTVAGWAIGATEVVSIKIFVDGVNVGAAALGFPRPDVATRNPSYKFASTSGFALKGLRAPSLARTVGVTAQIATGDGQQKDLAISLPVFHSAGEALPFLLQHPSPRPDAYGELAKMLVEAGNVADAERAIEAMRIRFADLPARYVNEARYLILVNRLEEADTLLAEASQKFPEESSVITSFAYIAGRRRDWRAAARRWKIVREKFPNHPRLWEEEGRVLYGAQEELTAADAPSSEAPVAASPQAKQGSSTAKPYAQLVAKFENLGSNCDFGLVQRYYGSEPLGLLRFSSAPLHHLLRALQNGLSGVGDAANTRFDLRTENGTAEYWIHDQQYDFAMHTFIFADENMTADHLEKLYRQQCRRLKFLKDKLLDDLRNPEKIFVYQRVHQLSDHEIELLFRVIRGYGAGTLLCVRPRDADHPAGTVDLVEQGLLVGHLDRFAERDMAEPAYETWLQICQSTDRLCRH
jgi:hypothetical protein